jgi:hypothetical protein
VTVEWNRYAYCINNPVNRTDPDGRVDGNGMGEPLDWGVRRFGSSGTTGTSNRTAAGTAIGSAATLAAIYGGAGSI